MGRPGLAGYVIAMLAALVSIAAAAVSILFASIAVSTPTNGSVVDAVGAEMPVIYDEPASSQIVEPQSDGVIYDMPGGYSQRIICDRANREYLLIESDSGGIAVIPVLDEGGNHVIMAYP